VLAHSCWHSVMYAFSEKEELYVRILCSAFYLCVHTVTQVLGVCIVCVQEWSCVPLTHTHTNTSQSAGAIVQARSTRSL